MITPSANDLLMARMAGASSEEHLLELDHLSRHLEDELRKTRAERDLAIAHDRQPYPTAAAYEAVCATMHKEKAEVLRLKKLIQDAPHEPHCKAAGLAPGLMECTCWKNQL